ncbi:hypothetical protein GQ600_17638 [Phytophthora cactorum]|nr:hypothetical protein GQ600_17638 [Phytophthora cactorum]
MPSSLYSSLRSSRRAATRRRRRQQHKRGLVLRRLTECVKQQVETLPRNWNCSEDDDASKQVQQVRTLLEHVVVQDAVAQASRKKEGETVLRGT